MSNFTRFLLLITTCLFCLGIQAQTCPGSLGTTVNIASLPYTGTGLTTCGAGNELTSSNVTTCGSSSYFGGEDLVFIFTPTSSGSITISLTSSSSWIGMMLYNGCPFIGQGGACVDNIQNSGGSKTLTVTVTSGVTYYLVVDTWPSPTCIPSFDLTIPAPAGALIPARASPRCPAVRRQPPRLSGSGVWNNHLFFSTRRDTKRYTVLRRPPRACTAFRLIPCRAAISIIFIKRLPADAIRAAGPASTTSISRLRSRSGR